MRGPGLCESAAFYGKQSGPTGVPPMSVGAVQVEIGGTLAEPGHCARAASALVQEARQVPASPGFCLVGAAKTRSPPSAAAPGKSMTPVGCSASHT